MKKILAIITTLFLMFSLIGYENSFMKVDSLKEATLGEYTLEPENWYINYNNTVNNSKVRQNTKMVTKDGYMFAQLFTGNLDKVRINLVPTFNTKFVEADKSLGRLSNVGEIKSIKLKCWNFGYNNTIYLNFRRSNGELYKCKMGTLNAHKKGPTELVFNNPGYIEDPKYKKFEYNPVYPNSANDLYLESIEIHSNVKSPCDGYNFIGIGDIDIIYDKAVLETENDIDFDEMFGIDNTISEDEKAYELNKLARRKAKEDYNKSLMDNSSVEISEK